MVKSTRSQLNYILFIDYLTDLDERDQLIPRIAWTDHLWTGLVSANIKNLNTIFDTDNIRQGAKVFYQSSRKYESKITSTDVKTLFSEIYPHPWMWVQLTFE